MFCRLENNVWKWASTLTVHPIYQVVIAFLYTNSCCATIFFLFVVFSLQKRTLFKFN
jgi:hypothetical protein